MNELVPYRLANSDSNYLKVAGQEQVRAQYRAYLQDESRLEAEVVEAIHFPTTTAQVASALDSARRCNHRVAISGARTGIVGGAVPFGAEDIISLEQLKGTPILRLDEEGAWVVRVVAGMTIDELTRALNRRQFTSETSPPQEALFYPVDTTEGTAQVGGNIATNASGARTLYYGPTRNWVKWLKVVMPDARVLELRRGEVRAQEGILRYLNEDGSWQELHTPNLPLPPTKNTVGYPLQDDMDAIDLFIGCEGTLGIITEAELRLIPKPRNCLFLTLFPDQEETAIELVSTCKSHSRLTPLALEYIGPGAIELLRCRGSASGVGTEVARLPRSAKTTLYAEFNFDDEAQLDRLYADLKDIFASLGLNPDNSWAGFTERDMEEMKSLRHAVPETVNTLIGQRKRKLPELHKVGTDMAVPDEALPQMMHLYRRELEARKLDFVIFGHIGDGHLHVNILPENLAQLEEAKSLYEQFAREAVRLGGSVASKSRS